VAHDQHPKRQVSRSIAGTTEIDHIAEVAIG
jgi:hypothetical protein